jgi:dihydropteroate synthase
MHWRGHSEQMASRAVYGDVVAEVRDELCARVDTLVSAGVDPARLVLDPGIGFAKEAAHGWALLAHLDALDALGFPLLVGASRKRFLGRITGVEAAGERVQGSVAAALAAAARGARVLRVHDVAETVQALAVMRACDSAGVDEGEAEG